MICMEGTAEDQVEGYSGATETSSSRKRRSRRKLYNISIFF